MNLYTFQQDNNGENHDFLDLTLAILTASSLPPSIPAPPPRLFDIPPPFDQFPIPHQLQYPPQHHRAAVGGRPPRRALAARRPSNQILGPGKSETIPQLYPWATARRATVHSIGYLKSKGINTITGRVQCKKCDRQFDVEYDLPKRFKEVATFLKDNAVYMCARAPNVWMNPALPDCKFCKQKECVRPIWSNKRSINWLFLFLGEKIGCCKLSELKYFCKHTRNHRTGAKDRVLYLTYVELCNQLDPTVLEETS